MTRTSPNETAEDRFNDQRDLPASEIFARASEIDTKSNFYARQLDLACVAVEEEDRK
jgi:hypothetical protein